MRIIGFEDYQKAFLAPVMEGIEVSRDTMTFELKVKVESGLDTVVLSLGIGSDQASGVPPVGDARTFEFDDCFPLAELPRGAIDFGMFALGDSFTVEGALEAALATLLMTEARLTISFDEEFTKEDGDVHGYVFMELVIGRFITSATLALEAFGGLLVPTKAEVMVEDYPERRRQRSLICPNGQMPNLRGWVFLVSYCIEPESWLEFIPAFGGAGMTETKPSSFIVDPETGLPRTAIRGSG